MERVFGARLREDPGDRYAGLAHDIWCAIAWTDWQHTSLAHREEGAGFSWRESAHLLEHIIGDDSYHTWYDCGMPQLKPYIAAELMEHGWSPVGIGDAIADGLRALCEVRR